jgi:hypothetical protein
MRYKLQDTDDAPAKPVGSNEGYRSGGPRQQGPLRGSHPALTVSDEAAAETLGTGVSMSNFWKNNSLRSGRSRGVILAPQESKQAARQPWPSYLKETLTLVR